MPTPTRWGERAVNASNDPELYLYPQSGNGAELARARPAARTEARAHEDAAVELASAENGCKAIALPNAAPVLCSGPSRTVSNIAGGVRVEFTAPARAAAALPRMRCHLAYAKAHGFSNTPDCALYIRDVDFRPDPDPRAFQHRGDQQQDHGEDHGRDSSAHSRHHGPLAPPAGRLRHFGPEEARRKGTSATAARAIWIRRPLSPIVVGRNVQSREHQPTFSGDRAGSPDAAQGLADLRAFRPGRRGFCGGFHLRFHCPPRPPGPRHHLFIVPGLSAPDTTGSSGCHAVLISPYSSLMRDYTWGGIPIALPALGVFAFCLSRHRLLLRRQVSRRETGFLILASRCPC